MAAEFASTWGTLIPDPGDLIAVTCPRCGSEHAFAERVGNTVYGSHDGPAGCGWLAGLRVEHRPGTVRYVLVPRESD
jgi:hypothetical protein